MSSIARWSYKNTATVRPFIGIDSRTGVIEYGEDYDIACTWIGEIKVVVDQRVSGVSGKEFTSTMQVFCEDKRPNTKDLICVNDEKFTFREIGNITSFDMSAFNDTPDYTIHAE